MPSEAHSEEPRDRGPLPPITRAGRSAQLAKAAATSPTPERRPRGRPRKDGSSSRSAPPAHVPPPPPKSKKKGRSRGRAQVDDEESMDTTEKTPSQKTEVKEEKTTGRRRSTSRKKLNTKRDPEPSQDRLSPQLEPAPAVPPHEPNVEPSSSAEEEDGCIPAAPLSNCSPGDDSRVTALLSSPSQIHSPRPAVDPVMKDQPSLSHSPTSTDADHNPSLEAMEKKEGKVSPATSSPIVQSPAPSPCSSPPVSPYLRLEDEDSLSPLFQRSLSEDSGGSPTPSLGDTKKRLKQCAFCYRGDELPLGQGRLVVFGPTPGYIPLHILSRRASSDRDSDCHDHCYRSDQAQASCSSPEQCDSSSKFVEQLGPIGLPHDINVQSLFDPTGQCCAHLQCAAWSEGVCRGEGQSLLYVDKAIDLGCTQVCAFCRRLGASLRCQESGCAQSYHFPCATAAGAYQDWNQRRTWCTRHTNTVSSQCEVCLGGGDVSGLLVCCCCGNCYHGSCLEPPLTPSPLCRVGWQCPHCRVCQSCRLRGDKGALLVCEHCDKAYHAHCLSPPLDHTPSTNWSCKNCRVCCCCGVTASGQWANHPFLCKSCDPTLPCPLCDQPPDHCTPQEYLTCTCCYRCVHTECILQAGEGRAGSEDYICSTCRPREEELIPHTPVSKCLIQPLSPKQTQPIEISQLRITHHTEPPPVRPTAVSPVHLEPPQSPSKTVNALSEQSLTPSHLDPTEFQQGPLPDPTVLQQSPVPSQPDPTVLQQSPVPSQPDPTVLQQSPVPSQPDPTVLQQSPVPSQPDPSVLQQSPVPSQPDPSVLQQSPVPSQPDPSVLQQSPVPSLPDPSVLQQSPVPSQPDPAVLQQSPASPHPDHSGLQQSPVPSQPDPTVLQQSPASPHPDHSGLQQSPLPSQPDPTVLQQSPASPHPDHSGLQQSPVPSQPDPTVLQQSPASPHPDHSGLQQSPDLSQLDFTELPQCPAPPHPDPTDAQQCPAPPHPDPTDAQQSPAPPHPDPTDAQQSPAPPHPDPTDAQQSPAPPCPYSTDFQESSVPSHPDLSELQKRPAPSHSDLSELQHSASQVQSNSFELQVKTSSSDAAEPDQIPKSPDVNQTELKKCPLASQPGMAELETMPLSFSLDIVMGFQVSLPPTHHSIAELHESAAQSPASPTEIQERPMPSSLLPAELQQGPDLSTQPQNSPHQLSYATSSPTPNSTVEQHLAIKSKQSPLQSSSMFCSPAHASGFGPSQSQPAHAEPQHSPPSHSPAQDIISHLNRPCSPTNVIPQHSHPQAEQYSPTQVCISPPQSSTQEAESTLDQLNFGCGISQDISTLDKDVSEVYCMSTQEARSLISQKPISAPCSSSSSPLRLAQYSLSHPASPVQAHLKQPLQPFHLNLLPPHLDTQSKFTEECTKTSTAEMTFLEHSPVQPKPNLDDKTLENSPGSCNFISELVMTTPEINLQKKLFPVQCSMRSPGHSNPSHICHNTPESLVHISTSAEHSSLSCSPCADEEEEYPPRNGHIHQCLSCESPLHCTDATEDKTTLLKATPTSVSPTHASETPTTATCSFQARASPMAMDTGLAHDSTITADTSPSPQPASPVIITISYSLQSVTPLASTVQPANPSGIPVSCQDKEMAITVEHRSQSVNSDLSPSNCTAIPGSSVHTSPTHVSPVHTEGNSSCLMDFVVKEKSSSSSSRSADLAQTQTSQSSTHILQSSPSHVQTTYDPSPTSPQPTPISFSPPHCNQTDTSPATTSVIHSLGNITSDYSGQTGSCTAIADVSPPSSSSAGQASPVHIQSTSASARLGPNPKEICSSANITHSSPAHASIACSQAQASKTYHSPTSSPCNSLAPDTGTNFDLIVASSLDVDISASTVIQGTALPGALHLDTGLLEPSDIIRLTSPSPAFSPPDGVSAVCPSQASRSQVCQSLASPQRSADESQKSTALVNPLDQRPGPLIDVNSTQASLSQASPGHSSPTQDNTAMPSTSHTSETSVPQTFCSNAPNTSAGHSSPSPSTVSGPLVTQTIPDAGPTIPVQPEVILSPGPSSSMRCEESHSPDPVCPSLATPAQPENNPSPVPSDGGTASPQQNKQTDEEFVTSVDIYLSEEVVGQGKTEKEGTERDALQVEESHQTTKENIKELEPVERTEEGKEEAKEGVRNHHLSPPHHSAAYPCISQSHPPSPQPTKPHYALPLHHPSSSPSSPPTPSLFSSPKSPSPPRAGSLEASPNSSPHRTALPFSCSPHTPLEDHPEVEEPTDKRKTILGLEDGDRQSQSQFELVLTATEPTKDNSQSHNEPSERREVAEEQEEKERVTGSMGVKEVENAKHGAEQEDQSDIEEEELVGPVLDLDPSLDMEVVDLMTSSPSPPPLSRRGKGHNLRPPPCSSRPSDDLSIRLRQSPFSTEASPETSPIRVPISPPPLSPLSPLFRCSPPARESPPLSKAQVPTTTVLPLTPKIGMGKPAISKRKFSPGRARVKQGSWWSNRRAVSPPSYSQDSLGEGGWDSPKPRPLDSPLWSMRVGRGSGFPGRRRSRGGGVGGGRGGGRGRSRLKTQDTLTVSPGSGYVEPFQPKEEEENSMHNTVVMFSTSDHFTLRQDMCVVCGSFGQGAEGRLLACSQCGQCYHPYCVNVKITRVVLTKGWRCLECTVCEACGEASDPGRLLLCDDCDISYHTYCLDPPLHTVPKGAWKCKWCVWCVQCGSTSPGLHCDWQSNYSRCGPCASLSCCPLCQRPYTQDDLILQCQQCDRWVHAVCQGLTTEDQVEVTADEGFDCSLCKTHGRGSHGRSDSLDSPYMAQVISRIREPDTKTYTQDGVCLTESGLSHLQSLVEPLTSPRRYRRCKPKLKLRIINQNSVSVLQTPPDPDLPTEHDHNRGDLECEMKSDSSPERDHAHDDDVNKETDLTSGNKKRKRKPYRPGIGGFMVRQRGAKAGPGRIKLCRKDLSEMLLGRDEGLLDADMETVPPADQAMEKVKKRYRKKKTKLEEAFPSYLQEAFFGRDLLDQSRQVDRMSGPEKPVASQSAATSVDMKVLIPGFHGPSISGLQIGTMSSNSSKKTGTMLMSEDALVDLSDVLNTDPHILSTGPTGQFQVERSPSPFAGLDISAVADDPSLTSDPTGSGGQGHRVVQEEPLDVILSPELDKMVTDGAILNKLYKIPELEGKDVEEVFTAVLSPNSSNNQQSEQCQHAHTSAGNKMPLQHTAGVFPRLPLLNGLMGAATRFPHTPVMPNSGQGPAGLKMLPSEKPPQDHGPTNQVPAGEGDQDVMSTAQRGMLKWEKEETLGDLATVAPVLYCNTNFPQLKEQYPDWTTRVKQITKLWRKASSQDRAPYVQKARDNRAAQRINKVQLNEPLKRHPPSQQRLQQHPPLLPPPGPYDLVSMETEVPFRDPMRPRESEQEQEWKLRQQMRQKSKQLAKMEATQKLEQVKKEQLHQQRQQQLLTSHRLSGALSPETGSRSPMTPTQPPTSGDSSSPLHPPAFREGQSRQHGTSGLADDVFLRPQAPPPSGFPSLPHSPHPSSPLYQPPTSPQMFSPPSSRPSSPWDPYSKVVGTPRPTSSQSGGPPGPQQQRRNSLSASPAHDVFGSPALSPDSKTSDVTRVLGPQPGLPSNRAGMMSPPSGSAPEHSSRQVGVRATETYQRIPHNTSNLRSPASGELVQGGVFKAPMPPQHQPQQEVLGSTGGGVRRDPSRSTDLGFALSQSQDFPSSPLSGLGSPHRSPYAQAPGTPRPDYSQQTTDPFSQQSPLASRPSPDPYSNPQTPGTPRPHSDPMYLPTPPSLRLDQYNQQSTNRRLSPSHPTLDSYVSNPGPPHPSVTERFPRSPGNQRSTEPYAQPVGTPRPTLDPYVQQSSTPQPQKLAESFTTHSAASRSSPLAPSLAVETTPFPGAHHQSPGRQQQDSFPRTPSNQTPKHPGMSEEGSFSGLAGQTPNHDSFEQGHMRAGHSETDKTTTNEMAALATASLDGPMSMLPQIGDSEEKLRQRQRLRQLLLRQQQQKSVLRQEKGLHEPTAGPTVTLANPPGPVPGSGAPRHWSQEDSSTTPPTDLFCRPPPPYPGIVKPGGPAVSPAPRFPGSFPGEQQRGFVPSESHFPRQGLPRELGVRGLAPRFSVPPGTPAGLQDSFLRPHQASMPGSGLTAVEGVPVQMRRAGEFARIRPLPAPNTHPHMIPVSAPPGVPHPFLPRSLPIPRHSVMGQPYIELWHRAPDTRMRLPFPLPATLDTEAPLLHARDPQPAPVRPSQGTRLSETPLEQQMVMVGCVEQVNQPHLGHTVALTQSSEATLSGADGIEEHLEGEDSAVKDLEDVEVKDLVDLNLNLDPEDGKEDLDLGASDLHLDDFLLSGKFDLIAYADPELNLEDSEDLDLEEPVEEKEGGERNSAASVSKKTDRQSDLLGQVKQEEKDVCKTEDRDRLAVGQQSVPPAPGLVAESRTSGHLGAPGVEMSGSSALLPKENMEESSSDAGALQDQEQAPRTPPQITAVSQSIFKQQQRTFGTLPSPSAAPLNSQPPLSPHPMALQSPQPRMLLNPEIQTPHTGISSQTQKQAVFPQNQVLNQNKSRPLLLEEQPLLLQDLLDQERQEQQQQKHMQALIRQRSTSDTQFPDMADFDSIMKAKMVALKGINKVMTQSNMGLNPMVINRLQQAPAGPVDPVAPDPEGISQPPHPVGQDGKLNPQLVRPSPPSFAPGFVNETQRRQYEEWLAETQQLLQMQQRLLEDQIAAHRKTKKALSAKQRTAKKAGRAFAEEDAAQLRYITEQQGAVQKQLEQIRKQQKDHAELIEDYRTKQQQQRALQQQQPPAPPIMPAGASSIPQTLLPSPVVPMQPHPSGPTPVRVPNVSPGWTSGSGAPGVMGQRMPPHLPQPQIPPALPNNTQATTHTQPSPAMVPGLVAPKAGFTAGPRGPAGGPNGAAVEGAPPTPQVKFDDNNPFSEGFQERERRERLREQQERQRVQLMQEVERHRALQQRLELEQQGLLSSSVGAGVGTMPPTRSLPGSGIIQTPGPGGSTGPVMPTTAPSGDSLSQMPFFSSELPQDFLQSPPTSRPPPQHQVGPPFLQPDFTGSLLTGVHPGSSIIPVAAAELGRALPEHATPVDAASSNHQTRPRLLGPAGPSAQGQVRPPDIAVTRMTLSHLGGHRFGQDSSSSSPSTPLAPSFPCTSSGAPAPLMQLYAEILPDDKPKTKRSRKKDGDAATEGGGARTPLSSHSDDITAPPTPAVSDTSCSTPTRASMDQSDLSFSQSSSLAPLSEMERQMSVSTAAQKRASALCIEFQRGPLTAAHLEVKLECEDAGAYGGGVVKLEEGGCEGLLSPCGDSGKELLRHLLKDKTSPANTPSPTLQAPLTTIRQLSSDSIRSEDGDRLCSYGNIVSADNPGLDLLDSSGRKKTQRCKRLARPEKDRAPSKYKRRKKEEEDKILHSSTTTSDQLVTHLRQLSVLPLVEPDLGVDLSLFPPYGSSSLGRDSRLTGSFGNACLDGVSDYYSQLIYKQNNLSNPPTPPASLPPTPPPVARQKLVNGFALTEELAQQELTEQDVSGLNQKGDEILDLNNSSKTVDVPASLPTPPHNNQEDLRVQDMSERDSPNGFIPSSSPESVADMEVSRYPDLSFIKLEPPSPCLSPTIPMIPCALGKGSAMKQEVKPEPTHQGPPSCSNTDLVTIAITLNPVAAQNVVGVMAAIAELLRVPGPVNYQLSRPSIPEQSSLALLAGVRVPLMQGSAGGRQRPSPTAGKTGGRLNYIQYGVSAAARPQCCSYCKVLLGNGVRIVRELKQEGQTRPASSLVFCSPNCSALYTSEIQSRSSGNKAAVPVLESGSDRPLPCRMQHQYTNNMSSIAVHSLPLTPASVPPTSSSSPPLSFPPSSAITMEPKPRTDSLKVKVKLKPHPRAVPGREDLSWHGKRMRNSRWRRWSINITLSRGPCVPNEAVAMPMEEEMDILLKKLGVCLRPDPLPKDQRRCCFCHQQGDGRTDGPARLLNLDLDLWVHLNCALWSSEVYETQAGALINVELALRRGLTLRCAHCQQTGATSGCNRLRCTNTYHFTCALQAHCTFFKDKTMLCHLHKPRTVPLIGDRSSCGSPSTMPGPTPDPAALAASDPYDSELHCFAVFRRVYVQRDEARQIAAVVQRGEQQHTFRVGSLLFRAIGRLLPHQMNTFHNKSAIFPVGYHANRIYWSMRYNNRRCKYICNIEDLEGEPLFKVKVVEKGHDDLILTGPTPKAVWDQILEPVSQMRASSGTLKLFPVYLKGEDLFGLTTSAVTRILESLPGVETCERYTFRFGRNPLMEWPLAFNPSGSARTEPKACQAKRTYLLTSIAPRCQGSVGSIVGLVPGVLSLSPGESVAGAHQGRHSKLSQYRRMKAEWKSNVYLARSRIQGLGLYAARDIEKCTMVIEYIGTIIRSEVANRKERLYESQNRGVYMFRIDNDYVIDATITGGPARYINHSCAPNCITEVVTVEKENKIIISSCRRIQRGEELCYDYKFDLEDDQHKIPCHCGAVNCRKWMN